MKRLWGTLAAVALWAAAGCGHGPGNEQKLADDITQAVYNNDLSGVQQNFSSDTAAQVTRASLGTVSDMMHALGSYKGISETGSDLPARRYIFDAKFDRGDMTVRIRLDPNGKVAAYRVTPGPPQ